MDNITFSRQIKNQEKHWWFQARKKIIEQIISDINSKKNIPILSSFNGKVAFVGSQIKKYGNLILIKHDNGWLTAYSNVGKFTVKQGETVLQGQIIANSSMNKEIFHFQIRYKRNPVDPLKYLN